MGITRIVVAIAIALALSAVTVRDVRAAGADNNENSPNLFSAGEQTDPNAPSDQAMPSDSNLPVTPDQAPPSGPSPSDQNLTTRGLSNKDMSNSQEMDQGSGTAQSPSDNDMTITNDATPPPDDEQLPNGVGRKWPEWITNYGHRGGAPANAGVPTTSTGNENE